MVKDLSIINRVIYIVDKDFIKWFNYPMKLTLKDRIRAYLAKEKMAPSRLADNIGVKRWSLLRYLKYDNVTILQTTYAKVESYIDRVAPVDTQ